ncbi:MAG: uncharacterized protein JWP20_2625 [Roseomonas sp.]|nr:uncharacterized protein [Roseomonas sp.]
MTFVRGGVPARTLADLLPADGAGIDTGTGLRFILGSDRERVLPYLGLADLASRALAALQARGLRPGDEVVIALADPEPFILAFWACMLGRFVAVPVQPPVNDEHRAKLARIIGLLHRPFLIADAPADGVESASIASLLAEGLPPAPRDNAAQPNDIAFVQFSSGSTGAPKGVALTHARVLLHLNDFATSARMSRDDTFLSWFPLTHDMGLIGWHLIPLALGAWQCLMPTKLFVQRPSLWLAKASAHRATVLCTNNFGIKHFLKLMRPETGAEWNLAPVRLLFNAAEPISAALCEEFQDRLAPHGLARVALFPGYGLAEATLGVTFPIPGEPLRLHRLDRHRLTLGSEVRAAADPRDEITLVELGRPMEGVRLRVAGVDGTVVPDRVIGTVEIDSRSMTHGYHRDPTATAALFSADGWLRTGDAGFLDSDRLVLTGRTKEMLIQAGQNYWPQDLERLAEDVAGIELGKVVACGVQDPRANRELLVMFVQSRQEPAEMAGLARALRETLLRKAGLLVDHVVPIPAVPKTTSGKIERYKLAQRFTAGEFDGALATLAAAGLAARPRAGWRDAPPAERRHLLLATLRDGARLVLDTDDVTLDRSLFEQGLDSRRVVAFHAWAQDALGMDLPVSLPFEHPAIADIAAFVEAQAFNGIRSDDGPVPGTPALARATSAAPIAIIGMGCRLPGGADRPERFWELLQRGGDAIGTLPPSRGIPPAPVHGAFLPDVAGFDHGFFSLSPREVEALDPQARLLLEVAWESLEDAGQDIPRLAGGEIGVFAGIGNIDYALAQFHGSDPAAIGPYAYTGTAPSMAVGRIAHAFGFSGPVLAIDSACASSLVAVHLAVESLRAGECTLALAGGVNLILAPAGHLSLQRLGALSPRGACRPFDDGADGYVRAEGCGVVVLKPLDAALADGDRIHALVLGSAVNHDGRGSGFTAPNGPAQARVIRRALARAGVSPAGIGYVEAHGTGTPLGDPVELRALDSVFGQQRASPLPIGSLKGNMGHLESAAGIAGLIKAVLALRHRQIPRSLHFETPNRHVAWAELGVLPAAAEAPWPDGETPRRAGVSAFGLAGTNAHVVLQEAPQAVTANLVLPPVLVRDPQTTAVQGAATADVPDAPAVEILMPLSAASPEALRALATAWHDAVATNKSVPASTWAALAARRRGQLPHRAALRFAGRDDLLRRLAGLAEGNATVGLSTGHYRADRPARLGFVYSGQGTQWLGMGAALMRAHPVFNAAVWRCDAELSPLTGWSVAQDLTQTTDDALLRRTDRAQAAIFAVQYALTETLAACGIVPDCVSGHSCGEVAALLAAGVLSFPQACRVVAARGRLMQAAPGGGAMIAVEASAAKLAPLLSDAIEVAARNSAHATVLAMDDADVAALTRALDARALPWRRLEVGHAFHSRRMDRAAEALAMELADLSPAPPEMPVYSAALGRRLLAGEVDADWWRANLRAPVDFAAAIAAMLADETTHFAEIGPHPTLSRAIAEGAEAAGRGAPVIATLRRNTGLEAVLDACGALHTQGYDLRWDHLHPVVPPMPDDLPLYPWQRSRHWPAGFQPWSPLGAGLDQTLCHARVWQDAPTPAPASVARPMLLLARAGHPWAAPLANRIGATLCLCTPEEAGPALAAQLSCNVYRQILLAPESGVEAPSPASARAALRFLAAAVTTAARSDATVPPLSLLTSGAPGRTDAFGPDALWAFARCAATEHPELALRRIALGSQPGEAEADLLPRLLGSDGDDAELSVEGGALRVARLRRSPPAKASRGLTLRPDARYLITGGCGTLGLGFARMLAALGARDLVLLGRGGETPAAAPAIAALRAQGLRVTIHAADVTDPTALRAAIEAIHGTLPLAGIVHAAGVLEDATLAGLDPADPLAGAAARVLAPKLDGAWNLHEATAGLPLDFTILVSSASVLLGPAGQGVYAAANGFHDALAEWRGQQGLPTLSLRLGLVAGSAMAERMAKAGLDLAARGITPLSEAQISAALPELWGAGTPTATLMGIDATRWLDHMPSGMARNWCAALLPATAIAETKAAFPSLDLGHGAAAETALRRELTAIVAAVTGAAAETLAADRPLRELGVDSVMTLQIRDRIVQWLGCEVRITAFWAHPTIAAFAVHLAETLGLAAPVVSPEAEAGPQDVVAALADKWAKYL